jgi:hypothetical protein
VIERGAACAAIAVCAFVVFAASAVARPGTEPSFSIGPIQATFDPLRRETGYAVSRYTVKGRTTVLHVTWTLHLELVDKAGAPDPGTPGSGAAVDLGCTNDGVGVHEPKFGAVQPNLDDVFPGFFVWHHPDAADSIPPGRYHCNHLEMGPHGHQGLITVVVENNKWKCTATYKGTNSSTKESVKDGTASTPKCVKVG